MEKKMASEVGFVQRVEREIDDMIADTKHEIMDAREFCDAMAGTNAAYDVEDYEVTAVNFGEGLCVVQLTYAASGEQEEDRAYCGSRIVGEAKAVIDASGRVSYQDVTATVDDGDME
jgi:hypothetical protein